MPELPGMPLPHMLFRQEIACRFAFQPYGLYYVRRNDHEENTACPAADADAARVRLQRRHRGPGRDLCAYLCTRCHRGACCYHPRLPARLNSTCWLRASLTDVMKTIAASYQTVAPNVKITFTFDSSGTLQTQIENGAPADIFFSAAQKQMTALKDKGLTADDTIKTLLTNKAVLIVPADSKADISSFKDVATDKVKMVGLGEASVPVGQYAQDIFTAMGVWDAVKAKANFGSNVRAVLTWVEGGNVDCGVVYATDAAISAKVKVVAEAPADASKPIQYPAAVLKNSKHPDEAKAFLAYLADPEATKAFEAAGFRDLQGLKPQKQIYARRIFRRAFVDRPSCSVIAYTKDHPKEGFAWIFPLC